MKKELVRRIEIFDNDKENSLLTKIDSHWIKEENILNKNKEINIEAFNNVTKFREDYEYDYNTGALTYYLFLIDSETTGRIKGYTFEL